jgi:hypothetical protein
MTADYTLLSRLHGIPPKTDNVLSHRTSLNKLKMVETIQKDSYKFPKFLEVKQHTSV